MYADCRTDVPNKKAKNPTINDFFPKLTFHFFNNKILASSIYDKKVALLTCLNASRSLHLVFVL